MNTTTTSAMTHEAQSKNIKSQKDRILNLFKNNDFRTYTYYQVDAELGIKNSHKRISELLREGLIMTAGKLHEVNKYYNLYIYSSPQHREQLKQAMREQDFKAWLKQGERFKDLVEIKLK